MTEHLQVLVVKILGIALILCILGTISNEFLGNKQLDNGLRDIQLAISAGLIGAVNLGQRKSVQESATETNSTVTHTTTISPPQQQTNTETTTTIPDEQVKEDADAAT